MAGDKDWTAGQIVTAADMDDFVQLQTLEKFASASARDTALSARKREGMHTYQDDINTDTVYSGAAWSTIGPVHGGGISWTPAVTQSGSVTCTNNASTYFRLGRLVIAWFDLTVSGSGSASNDITISLPVTGRSNLGAIGVVKLVDVSATPDLNYASVVCAVSTSLAAFALTDATGLQTGGEFHGGAGFSAGLASGDRLTGSMTFEAGGDA